MKKFWMIKAQNKKGTPKKIHLTESEVKEEAKRLAAESPGTVFAVLESKYGFIVPLYPCTEIEYE